MMKLLTVKWAQTKTQDALSEHQETLFHCGGDQAVAHIAREVVESSSLEILKNYLDMVLDSRF